MNNIIKPVCFFLIICVLSLIGIEIVLHLVNYPNEKHEQSMQRIKPHKSYHHFHVPGSYYIQYKVDPQSGLLVKSKWPRFDERGLRDRVPLKESNQKILFIGDSFIEAFQVEMDEMFGNLVENNLENVDIVNVGCSSWASLQYYSWIKDNIEEIKQYKSVYLFYFPNDPQDSLQYVKESDNPLDLDNLTFNHYYDGIYKNFPEWKKFMRRYVKLWLLSSMAKKSLREQLLKMRQRRSLSQEDEGLPAAGFDAWSDYMTGIDTEEEKAAIAIDDYFIKKVASLLKDHRVSLTVVYIPIPWQVPGEEDWLDVAQYRNETQKKVIEESKVFQNRLQQLAGDNNFRFLDLTVFLREYKKQFPSSRLFNKGDGHFSVLGHEAVSSLLTEDIEKMIGSHERF